MARQKGRRARSTRRTSRLTPRRWLPFLVFVAVVAGLIAADVTDDPVTRPTVAVDRAGTVLPVAGRVDALSTAFFCSGGTARGDEGPAELAMIIGNAAAQGTTAEVTFVGTDGVTERTSVDLPARGRVRVAAVDHIEADWVAATVDVLGPEVTVDKTVNGPQGFEITPCPTAASDTWYVPSGSTEIGAEERLVLYNPFPAASSVDISFVTNDGRSSPRALEGYTVPGRSVQVIDTDLMPARKTEIAAMITARSGRIVVDRVQTYDGTGAAIPAEGDAGEVAAPTGLASTPGVATTSTRWMFPDVVSVEGSRTQIALFNPTDRPAEIDLVLTYEDPQRRNEIEPIRITLPEIEQRMVDLRAVPGLEPGERYTVRVESLGFDGAAAVPVVAEQVVMNTPTYVPERTETAEDEDENAGEGEGEASGDEAGEEREREQAPDAEAAPDDEEASAGEEAPDGEEAPEGESSGDGVPPEEQGPVEPELVDGLSIVGGSPVTAPTWMLSTSGASSARSGTVVVANLGEEMAEITVEVVIGGRRTALENPLKVPAGDRRRVDLDGVDPASMLVVSGTQPIVVSRTVVETDGDGISLSLAAPVPVGVRTLPPVG